MAQEEKYGERDLVYSTWHRAKSTRRYVGIEHAQLLAMIDVDVPIWIEYDDANKEPLALIETARDTGQSNKTATVTLNLARRANLPCFVVLYTLADYPNPADTKWRDIASFRVKRLYPKLEKEWRIMTPKQWAENLLTMRQWKASKLDAEYDVDQLITSLDMRPNSRAAPTRPGDGATATRRTRLRK